MKFFDKWVIISLIWDVKLTIIDFPDWRVSLAFFLIFPITLALAWHSVDKHIQKAFGEVTK